MEHSISFSRELYDDVGEVKVLCKHVYNTTQHTYMLAYPYINTYTNWKLTFIRHKVCVCDYTEEWLVSYMYGRYAYKNNILITKHWINN